MTSICPAMTENDRIIIVGAGPVELDTSRQELKVNGSLIELTSFEYRIIEHLMIRAGEVISKTELTDRLYDQDYERDSNVIEVFNTLKILPFNKSPMVLDIFYNSKINRFIA